VRQGIISEVISEAIISEGIISEAIISEVSEEVANQIAKNCRRQPPHSL